MVNGSGNKYSQFQPNLSDALRYLNYRHNDDEYVSDDDEEDEDEGWGITPGGADDMVNINVNSIGNNNNDIVPPPKEIVESVYKQDKQAKEDGNVSDTPPMAFGQYLQSNDVDTFNNNGNNNNNNLSNDYEVDDVSLSGSNTQQPIIPQQQAAKHSNFVPMTFGLQEMTKIASNNNNNNDDSKDNETGLSNINFSCQYGKLLDLKSNIREATMLVRIDNLSQLTIKKFNFKFVGNYLGVYSSLNEIDLSKNGPDTNDANINGDGGDGDGNNNNS